MTARQNYCRRRKLPPLNSPHRFCQTDPVHGILAPAGPHFPMRILIHAANLTSGGGLAVAASLLQAWSRRAGDRLLVLASPQLAALAPAGMPLQVVPSSPTASLRSLLRFRRLAAAAAAHHQADAVLTVFGPPLWRPQAPHLCGFANGLYLWKPEGSGPSSVNGWAQTTRGVRRWQVLRSLRRDADCLWVETAGARDTLLAALAVPKPVAVVPNALHAAFEPYRNALAPDQAPGLPFRLFMPAAGYPHKNFALVRQLLPLFAPGEVAFHLTLTDAEMEHEFGAQKHHPALITHGPVAPDALPALYAASDAVFTPSLLEIASAAWNEAAVMRRPLLAAAIPAVRSACGDSALYFAPQDAGEAAAAIRLVRDDAALRQTLVERGTARLRGIPTAADRVEALRGLLHQMTGSRTEA